MLFMKFRLLVLSTLLLTLGLSAACHGENADDNVDQKVKASTLIAVNQPAPDFTCQTTDGKNLRLSTLKGKVVLLYFFSATNLSSLTDLRNLENEIFQKLRDKDHFRIIAIGRDYQREELVKLGGELKLSFPLVADPQQEIYRRYFTGYVPRTVLIRSDGTIAHQMSGSSYGYILKLQSLLAHELTVKAP